MRWIKEISRKEEGSKNTYRILGLTRVKKNCKELEKEKRRMKKERRGKKKNA